MPIADLLASAHQRSVALYLQRQRVEAQRQALSQQAASIDMELVQLDGEIRVLTALRVEVPPVQ